jgi:glutamine cyclotransferase
VRVPAAALAALLCVAVCAAEAPAKRVSGPREPARRARYTVVDRHAHDPRAFLQGLVFAGNGVMLESTGLYGQSTLRKVDLASGRVVQRVDLPADVFGEGLAALGSELFQITWQNGIAYVYDAATLRLTRQMRYAGEGWGLASDGRQLVMSDGSANLSFRDPATFRETRRLTVTQDGVPVAMLNELEFIDGQVWANVWHRDLVLRIDPATGRVRSYLDLSGLLPLGTRRDPEAVLNGIAWDPATRHVFVCGKLWPWLFELKVD